MPYFLISQPFCLTEFVISIHDFYTFDEIGISPQEYLVSYRMDMAAEMLKDTDKKIQEIAEEVGYADQMSFSRAFKKYKKMSPTEYRMSE